MMTKPPALSCLRGLSSSALTSRLADLLRSERVTVVDFLWHLAEVERRSLHLELGYSSLFVYCTDALRLSKAAAWRRTTASRLIVRFPLAAEYLADGRLCLSTLVLLKDVLRPDNHRELLDRAAGASEDDVKHLVATLNPKPDVTDSIRRVSPRASTTRTTVGDTGATTAPMAQGGTTPPLGFGAVATPGEVGAPAPGSSAAPAHSLQPGPAALPAPTAPSGTTATQPPVAAPVAHLVGIAPPPRPRIERLNAERAALRISVGNEFLEELAQVKAALSHIIPDGNLEAILRECFRRTLESCARARIGSPKRRAHTVSARESAGATAASTGSPVGSGPEPTTEAAPAEAHSRPASGGSAAVCGAQVCSDVEPTAGGRVASSGTHVGVRTAVAPAEPARSSGPEPAPEASSTESPYRPARNATAARVDASIGSGPELIAKSVPAPGTKAGPRRSRYISVEVRRAVWARDGGRCAFIGADGKRCNATHQLQFDHKVPWALGGEAGVDDIQLLCREHNLHRARLHFGAAHMSKFSRVGHTA